MEKRLTPQDIDRIIVLIRKISAAHLKHDFLEQEKEKRLIDHLQDEHSMSLKPRSRSGADPTIQENNFVMFLTKFPQLNDSTSRIGLKAEYVSRRGKYIEKVARPLQIELDLYFAPRKAELCSLVVKERPDWLEDQISRWYIQSTSFGDIPHVTTSNGPLKHSDDDDRLTVTTRVIDELERIKAMIEYEDKAESKKAKPAEETAKSNTEQLRIIKQGCVFDDIFVKLSPQELVLLRAAKKGGKVRNSEMIDSIRLFQIKLNLNKKFEAERIPFEVTGTPTKGYCLIPKQA